MGKEAAVVCSRLDLDEPRSMEVSAWIPVSERLSEHGQAVLLTLASGRVTQAHRDDGRFFGDHQTRYFSPSGQQIASSQVLAWQPLPKPYTPEAQP